MSSGDGHKGATISGGNKPLTRPHARVAIPLPLSRPKAAARPKQQNQRVKSEDIGSDNAHAGSGSNNVQHAAVGTGARPAAAEANTHDTAEANTHNTTISSSEEEQSGVEDVHTPASSNGHPAPLPEPASRVHNLNDTLQQPVEPVRSLIERHTTIRTELPPAFVPQGEYQPILASGSGSSSQRNSQVFPTRVPINFGPGVASADGSASPSPIPNSQSGQHSPWPRPNQYGQHSPHASVFLPPVQVHHHSDSYSSHHNRQSPGWLPSKSQHSPHTGHYHRSSLGQVQQSPRESYGRHDYLPAKSTLAGPGQFLDSDTASYQNGMTYHMPPGFQPTSFLPPFSSASLAASENAFHLAQHTSPFSESPSYSDVELLVTLENDGSSFGFDGHKIILARSPAMLNAMSHSEASNGSKTHVQLQLKSPYAGLQAFRKALKWLYGGQLLGDELIDGAVHIPGQDVESKLRFVLAYISAGHYLELSAITQRGIEVIGTFLRWELLPLAFVFAAQEFSQAHRRHAENGDRSAAIANVAAARLYSALATYIAASLPPNFYLDSSSPEVELLRRLPAQLAVHRKSSASQPRPVTHRASRSTNDPRLSRIQFGELGGMASNDSQASPIFTIISSLLLSLPFSSLVDVFEHQILLQRLGISTLGSIMRQVVAERESRRVAAMQHVEESLDSDMADVLNSQELVLDGGAGELPRLIKRPASTDQAQ